MRVRTTYSEELRNNSVFRDYIDNLIALYSDIYTKVKQGEKLRNINDDEIERRILGLNEFNKNPFNYDVNNPVHSDEMQGKIAEKQKSKKYIKSNYSKWCFSTVLEFERTFSPKTKFCFEFSVSDNSFSFDF